MEKKFSEAMEFRHACKLFDTTKEIPTEKLEYILEAGRISPSSINLEHWKFLVIRNKELKEKIQSLAWNQKQITTSSELIAVLYRKKLRTTEKYTIEQFKKKFNMLDIPDLYRGFIDNRSDEQLECWSSKQTYIASANMMTAAAAVGIDSCPMEGFDYPAVEKLLNIDTNEFGIAMLIPFGYRVNEQSVRNRSEMKDLVEYKN